MADESVSVEDLEDDSMERSLTNPYDIDWFFNDDDVDEYYYFKK